VEFNSSVKVEGVNEGNPDFFADDAVSFFHAEPVFMVQWRWSPKTGQCGKLWVSL